LGGFFTHYLSWEWIFWINVPAGIVAIIVAYLWLEPSPPKAVPRLDKMGFVLFSMGLAGLTFGLSEIGETTAHKVIALNTLLLSVLLLGLYIVHSRRKAHPIVNGALFQSRPFRISVLGNLLSRLGFGGLPFLLPLLLQIGLDYSPQDAGILIAPIALGILLIKPFSLKILRYLGFKRLLIYNTFAVSLCLISFSAINSNTSLFFIILLTFFFGFLSTLQYSGMNTLAYAEVTPEQLSGATSIMSTMQQVSQSFGVAISAIFLRYFSMGLKLTLSDFHHAFIGIGLITLCSMIIFLRLKPEDGLQLIKEAGHKPPTV
jgi:MFS family permease